MKLLSVIALFVGCGGCDDNAKGQAGDVPNEIDTRIADAPQAMKWIENCGVEFDKLVFFYGWIPDNQEGLGGISSSLTNSYVAIRCYADEVKRHHSAEACSGVAFSLEDVQQGYLRPIVTNPVVSRRSVRIDGTPTDVFVIGLVSNGDIVVSPLHGRAWSRNDHGVEKQVKCSGKQLTKEPGMFHAPPQQDPVTLTMPPHLR